MYSQSIFKKLLAVLLLLVLVLGNVSGFKNVAVKAQTKLRVTNVVWHLGDNWFADSAERGLIRAKNELGIDYKTIQLTDDSSKWESGLNDAMAATNDYDILIAGTEVMADYLTARADNYPDKKFLVYDTSVDYTKCKCTNVYSILFAQNEGSYITGVYAAAMLRDSNLPNLSGKHTIGVVAPIPIPVIDDFIVGYEQGAKSVDPGITVLKQYIGGDHPFEDKPKAKEIALAMYTQGADIIFGIAGLGVTQAATSIGKWSIGVDADDTAWLKDENPAMAAQILTSMEKRIDNALYRTLTLTQAGKLLYGRAERIGLAEGAVGLAKNDFYNANTPDSVKKLVNQAEADVAACKTQVKTAFDKARPCVPTVLTPEPTSAARAATPVSYTAAPTVAPTQAQTTFSSKIFKLPMSVNYGTEWSVQDKYPDVITLMNDGLGVDTAFIIVKNAKIADPMTSFSEVPFPNDFVTWIQAHGLFPVVATQPVVVGGFQGIQINTNATPDCGVKRNWLFLSGTGWNCRKGEYYRFIYLDDVNGERILIMNTGGDNLSADHFKAGVQASQKVLDTVSFGK